MYVFSKRWIYEVHKENDDGDCWMVMWWLCKTPEKKKLGEEFKREEWWDRWIGNE